MFIPSFHGNYVYMSHCAQRTQEYDGNSTVEADSFDRVKLAAHSHSSNRLTLNLLEERSQENQS